MCVLDRSVRSLGRIISIRKERSCGASGGEIMRVCDRGRAGSVVLAGSINRQL